MDTLKDKLPVIGIGLAACAIAGYIVFGLDKGDKKKEPEAPAEEHIEAEEPSQPMEPRFDSAEKFFIAANLSQEEKMK
jgi:flagellar basal body-associated protein FliL